MNGELLAALESLEREKGISKEVLCSAIESAIASAAYKIIGNDELDKEDISVEMDRVTGGITVYSGNEEVRSEQFGRIAAQTAKQVMIQKIREAERDVIFDKYSERVGEIINGAVHRFEKGNMIIELDDTEAVLPKNEQIPREKFRQGQTIRTFLVEVERRSGGLDIVLSRGNTGFVKKLFELEVPEIAQGIVEIKAIAREAGDRTKMAVYSKDERIDAVGACVGMRGSRVKEIVQELSGERIDIVRWSDDIHEYVQAAVSPVELYSMEVDRENGAIKVAVTKDQLALLIGKKGRNIRLASKLVGWEIKADTVMEKIEIPLKAVAGLSDDEIGILEGANLNNTSVILDAAEEGRLELEGIDEERLKEIRSLCEQAVETVINTQAEGSAMAEEKVTSGEGEGSEDGEEVGSREPGVGSDEPEAKTEEPEAEPEKPEAEPEGSEAEPEEPEAEAEKTGSEPEEPSEDGEENGKSKTETETPEKAQEEPQVDAEETKEEEEEKIEEPAETEEDDNEEPVKDEVETEEEK